MKANGSGSSWLLVVACVAAGAFPWPAAAQTPPSLNLQLSKGGPVLNITGDIGTNYLIQSATSLSGTNPWQEAAQFQLSSNPASWVDLAGAADDQRFYRVTVVARAGNPDPAVMALIPAGDFIRGDTFSMGSTDELPTNTVTVSAFHVDRYEVTWQLWSEVSQWATNHGYRFANSAQGKATNHPAHSINWYDAVKWCNARSEKEGRAPAYYTDAGLTQCYREGQADPFVNWNAGYRLPTEAEWEKAARGGTGGHRFPWTLDNTISHARANYYSGAYVYDTEPTLDFHPAYSTGDQPYTSPVGSFEPNGYGLFDMAGNVWEWCWDRYQGYYYSVSPRTDPRGPDTNGNERVGRGGSWYWNSFFARVTARSTDFATSADFRNGFRAVLPASQP